MGCLTYDKNLSCVYTEYLLEGPEIINEQDQLRMNEIGMSEKEKRKFIHQLLTIKKAPAEAIKKSKRIKNSILVFGMAALVFGFLFYNSMPDLAQALVFMFAGALIGASGLLEGFIKQMPLTVQVIDWNKVEQLAKENNVS